jgi:hypothetical protein
MRKDERVFNHQQPSKLGSASFNLCNYDQQFFKAGSGGQPAELLKDYLPKNKLFRNDVYNTEFDLEGFNVHTSRGGASSMLRTFYHRTNIHYNTNSTQDNRMDMAMGIQANKGQNQKHFPKQFLGLIWYLKARNIDKIDAYFDSIIDAYLKQLREAAEQKRQAAALAAAIVAEQKRKDAAAAQEAKAAKKKVNLKIVQEDVYQLVDSDDESLVDSDDDAEPGPEELVDSDDEAAARQIILPKKRTVGEWTDYFYQIDFYGITPSMIVGG